MERQGDAPRIAALDLIRGIAVLGILAINIASLAGPAFASLTPHYPDAASAADEAAFALSLLLFEGKMRGLFTLLFGAGLVLFIDRAEARGRDGTLLQARRLGWLALLGYLHFLLVWHGDILFTYALVGLLVLALHDRPLAQLGWGALAFFVLWHGAGTAASLLGPGNALAELTAYAAHQTAMQTASYGNMLAQRLTGEWSYPLAVALSSLGETGPLMVMGMVLYHSGFFTGSWRTDRLWQLATGGTLLGGALTLGWLAWAWPRHFPPAAMLDYLLYYSAFPHLPMILGYAAALVLAAPRLLTTRLGQRLAAAGRVAFSNYVGTGLVMGLIFNGWGLGQFNRHGAATLLLFVLAGWLLMLAWSAPWLARFRQGPLEWLWRSLTEWRLLPLRRSSRASS